MKTNIKKTICLLIILTMAAAAFACKETETKSDPTPSAGSVSTPAADSTVTADTPDNTENSGTETAPTAAPASVRDTVTIAVTMDSGTLDPMIISGNDIVYAVHMIYDQLWYTDENAQEVMMLAESREQLDPLHYRLHLRQGITFSNGSAFEADDVLYSLDHANNRPGQPGIIPQLDVANSVIVDAYTIDIAFTEFRITLMGNIGGLCIFDKQTCEADPDSLAIRPVGTGPYELTDYVVNSHLTLKRRDTYWGTMPAIENYNFVILQEESQRVNALEAGEVDIADIPAQDIEYVKQLPDVNVNQTDGFMGSGLYFNIAESSVFYNNLDARRAVAYAIDRDAINKLAFSDTGVKPNSVVAGGAKTLDGVPEMLDMGIYGDDYDPELAKELAESSGLVGKSIRLINNGSSTASLTSELIQAQCKTVGITVEVMTMDMGTWVLYLFDETQYDMCIDGVPLAGETFAGSFVFCYPYMAAGSYTNYDYPGHDSAMEIVDTILTIDDIESRKSMNLELAQTAVDNMLWYNLVSPTSALGMAKGLEGAVRNGYNVVCLYRNLYWTE